ncbi:MAG: hypothetical protein Q4D89_06510 [Arachnia propionica]|uniref:hypothetical protein n=1 Tax=Arachnia propionica TaxID=1750 RepID=UPI0026FA9B0E|nr:hypothetical protein [Arachnia propionica]
MFRPAVARFLTDAPPDEVLRLAEVGLTRDAYRRGTPQLQTVVDARGLGWRVLSMERGVERKLLSVKGCLFALIPEAVLLFVPRIARHQGDQTIIVAARSTDEGTEVLHREYSFESAPFNDHSARALWRLQDILQRAGYRVTPPEHIRRRDVPADWPVETATLVSLRKEARRHR